MLSIFIFGCSSSESKQQNNVIISKITFESGRDSIRSPSFQLQIYSSTFVLYNGLADVEKKGYYTGNIKEVVWKDMVNNVHSTDLAHLKRHYGQKGDESQTLTLSIETDKGTYYCKIYNSVEAPPTLRDLIKSIFNNYGKIDMKPLDIENMLQSESSTRRKMINEILERIPG